MKLLDGRWATDIAFKFHILTKDKLRAFIECDGKDESLLDELPFDERLAQCEAGDNGFVPNEEFLYAMIQNYSKVVNTYFDVSYDQRRKDIELKRIDKVIKFGIAVYRNDVAYFERIGGIISFIVHNADKFKKIKNIDQEYSALIENVHTWWKVNDKRKRTKFWIDWVFKYAIRKYKTDMFYRRSINMMLIFAANNADKWKGDEQYDPNNWFPKKRGKFCNAIYNGNF